MAELGFEHVTNGHATDWAIEPCTEHSAKVESPDWTGQMHKLTRIFVLHILHKSHFAYAHHLMV